ncbi:vegetative cell wall protein gp1-like [Iris pallida]|uniref:Vegetative cell wall protein gp1-like n=1 Tax=Iris pallida TaxID=29817 RepID=A0AAX6E3W6_IRIPA|nr:vegetative cell wall protein gp1-like [Iris pallida]
MGRRRKRCSTVAIGPARGGGRGWLARCGRKAAGRPATGKIRDGRSALGGLDGGIGHRRCSGKELMRERHGMVTAVWSGGGCRPCTVLGERGRAEDDSRWRW